MSRGAISNELIDLPPNAQDLVTIRTTVITSEII
jgi:hypothetical protein